MTKFRMWSVIATGVLVLSAGSNASADDDDENEIKVEVEATNAEGFSLEIEVEGTSLGFINLTGGQATVFGEVAPKNRTVL